MEQKFRSIGTIYTPYMVLNTPHQPVENAPGEFWITMEPEYAEGLKDLDKYRYIYVIYHLNQTEAPVKMIVNPSWAGDIEIGLFASRSPDRPNPIGLSIVKIKEIQKNDIIISGIDVYNGTPLLDIKPYINTLDVKIDANDGWFDELQDKDHLVAHMLGLQHDHNHTHEHEHEHEQKHHHRHY